MNAEQAQRIEGIADNIIECWTRIKAKARAEGHITNIEKHAPCLTGALNALEKFLPTVKEGAAAEIVEDHIFRVEEGGRNCAQCGKPFDQHEYN